MTHSDATDVLVVGAGPVGLTAAVELRRRGVACRLVDRLPARLPYAKAVGIQPRTLEIWDRMGLVRAALDAAVPMRGQLSYVNGVEQPRIDLVLPPEVPYGFAALPQYETERILEEHLARYGTRIERGTALVSFAQDADGVTGRLVTASGAEEEVRTRYLVGCDGAHSAVRKGLGLSFEGGAFPEEYMLADVEVGWDLPYGYGVRATHHGADGAVDDLLVCIPLPGRGRYRMSMLVPPGLSAAGKGEAGKGEAGPGGAAARPGGVADAGWVAGPGGGTGPGGAGDGVAHGLGGGPEPALADIQAVLDRLAPQPVTASAMRWSSVFRISHRLVNRYGDGRVFVAGDAAHIHPPTGAQGMNTGIQDAYNLAWKLALAVEGAAHPQLLPSYGAERLPVGEEVVGRTVRHAVDGMDADPLDKRTLLLREAQLLVGYRGSPIVDGPASGAGEAGAAEPRPQEAGSADGLGRAAGRGPAGPRPGDRAPDCGGLTDAVAAYPLRLYDLLRDRTGHVLLLYRDGPEGAAPGEPVDELTLMALELIRGSRVEAFVVAAAGSTSGKVSTSGNAPTPGAASTAGAAPIPGEPPAAWSPLPVYRDGRGEFARAYGTDGPTVFVVRPDGYLGARLGPSSARELAAHLSGVLRM